MPKAPLTTPHRSSFLLEQEFKLSSLALGQAQILFTSPHPQDIPSGIPLAMSVSPLL